MALAFPFRVHPSCGLCHNTFPCVWLNSRETVQCAALVSLFSGGWGRRVISTFWLPEVMLPWQGGHRDRLKSLLWVLLDGHRGRDCSVAGWCLTAWAKPVSRQMFHFRVPPSSTPGFQVLCIFTNPYYFSIFERLVITTSVFLTVHLCFAS